MPGRHTVVNVVFRDWPFRFNFHCFSFFQQNALITLSLQILEWQREDEVLQQNCRVPQWDTFYFLTLEMAVKH